MCCWVPTSTSRKQIAPLVVQFYRESRKSHKNRLRLYKITCTRIQTNDHLQLLKGFISDDDTNQFKFSSFNHLLDIRGELHRFIASSLHFMECRHLQEQPKRGTQHYNRFLLFWWNLPYRSINRRHSQASTPPSEGRENDDLWGSRRYPSMFNSSLCRSWRLHQFLARDD